MIVHQWQVRVCELPLLPPSARFLGKLIGLNKWLTKFYVSRKKFQSAVPLVLLVV